MEQIEQLVQASWPLLLMLVIFYFILWRPQKKEEKKRNDFLSSLKKGDRVITAGGLYGTITGFTDKSITLRVAEKVEIEVARVSVAQYQNAVKKETENKSGNKTDNK